MSLTKKGTKPPGAELWSKRPVSNHGGAQPGRDSKTRTHRLERISGKKEALKELV